MNKLERKLHKKKNKNISMEISRDGASNITLFNYDSDKLEEKHIVNIDECINLKNMPAVSWINAEGISDPKIIEKLGACFNIHPLVLEDILSLEQRPKIEDYQDYIYIVIKMLKCLPEEKQIEAEQVSIILGANFVISFQEGKKGDVFDSVRQFLRNDQSRLRKSGADFLAYSIIDSIVDNYFKVIEDIGDRIEDLEDELIENPSPETLHKINGMKRELIYLRRYVWPLREVVARMEKEDFRLIKESTGAYLRDVYDHVIQVIDSIETFREMLSGMLDIYLSSVSNRMNEVIKLLTIISTIFIPMTFIAGVYGMNFRFFPEINWEYGYAFFWTIIITIAVVMITYFKRKKWI